MENEKAEIRKSGSRITGYQVIMRLCYLLFTIDYFSVASVLSVAQTTVLIGVNPCLKESNLKKQSQYAWGQNERKYLFERRL